MRTLFFSIVILHGLIHLLGFTRAFDLLDVKELTLPISKPLGWIWLLVSILMILFGILHLQYNPYSWLVGFIATIFSQVLLMLFWQDAKFGSILNLLILFVVFIDFGSYRINKEFTQRVMLDISGSKTSSVDLLTKGDMIHLPGIVKKYLHFTRSIGQPKVKNFRAEFTGGIRFQPNEKFMKLQSVQYNFYENPSRYFHISALKMGLPATGLHVYQNKEATFEVRLFNWFKVVDAKGEKMNRAETVTILNDMCILAPPTLIDRRITWENLDTTTVRASFTNGDYTVSAILYFHENGQLFNFTSTDRFETDGKAYHNTPWETPVTAYKMINGYYLPAAGKAIYNRPEGDFTYAEFEFKSVNYNINSFKPL